MNKQIIKINSYILSDKTKNEMVNTIGMSIQSNVEYGFNLCLDKNEIKPGKICKGKTCSIQSKEFECKENEKPVGIFHTHQKYSSNPSIRDLSVGYLSGMNCIGSLEGIICFKRKKEDPDALEYAAIRLAEDKEKFIKFERDRWLSKEINNKEFKEEIVKYRKEVDRLVNSYFKTIVIMR